MLPPETVVQNRYQVLRLIGQGGMGAVYEAKDLRLRARVALKQTLVKSDELRGAFEREAMVLAHLRHPMLPRVIDHFEDGAEQFLVMDFIEGQDLGEMLAQRGTPFPVEQVMEWTERLLGVLEYLHELEPPIIHRDIKPQNLKLTPDGTLMLLDFGLAKGGEALLTRVTTNGSIQGYTPHYAPLEQIQDAGTDPRTDLYSLGATLYHLMTGVKPESALARASARVAEAADPLRPPHMVNPAIPPTVSGLILQAMSLPASARPESAEAMRLALREVIGGAAAFPPPLRGAMPDSDETVVEDEHAPADSERTVLDELASSAATELEVPPTPNPVGIPTEIAPHPRREPGSSRTGQGSPVAATAQKERPKVLLLGLLLPLMLLGMYGGWRWRLEPDVRHLYTVSLRHALDGHSANVVDVDFAANGSSFMSWSNFLDRDLEAPSDIKIWNTTDTTPDLTLESQLGAIMQATLSRNGSVVAFVDASDDGDEVNIELWDVSGSSHLSTIKEQQLGVQIALSPDGDTLATTELDNTIKLWDVNTGALRATLDARPGMAYSVTFSPDGTLLAVGVRSGTCTSVVELWDWSSRTLRQTLASTSQSLGGLTFTSDGTTLGAFGTDGSTCQQADEALGKRIFLWEVATGKTRATIEGVGFLLDDDLAFSPDGSALAFPSSPDGDIKVWDIQRGKVRATFPSGLVFDLRDGLLAIGSDDIELWDVDSQSRIDVLDGTANFAVDMAFNPEGTSLAIGGVDGRMELWEIASHE